MTLTGTINLGLSRAGSNSNGHLTFHKALGLEVYHQIQLGVTPRTIVFFGGERGHLHLCKDALDIF